MIRFVFSFMLILFLTNFYGALPLAQAEPASQSAQPLPANSYSIPNYNKDYPDYYNFAKNRLFDGQEFWEATSDSNGNGAKCSEPAASSSGDAQQRSQKLWGIALDGGALNDSRAKQIFETLCLLNSSSKFASLLKAKTTPVRVHVNAGGCLSHASASGDIDLNGYCGAIWTDRYILSHELGHIVNFRNLDLYAKWQKDVYSNKAVRHGFVSLPTWDCQFDYGTGPFEAECWADMISSYLTYKDMRQAFGRGPFGNGLNDKFNEYPTEYKEYYDFAKNEIFGGTDFYGSTGGVGANKDNCSGYYNFTDPAGKGTQKGYNPKGVNFGDPKCEFAKANTAQRINMLTEELKKVAPNNVSFWVAKAQCESTYNANQWTDLVNGVHTPAPDGAWGLFQMGSDMGKPGDGGGADRGDVYWRDQAKNAETILKQRGPGYWACH